MVYTSDFVPPIVGEALSLPQPWISASTQLNVPVPVGVANLATPWRCKIIGVYHNGAHSLSFAALSSSLREGAEAAAPQREAASLPYEYDKNRGQREKV